MKVKHKCPSGWNEFLQYLGLFTCAGLMIGAVTIVVKIWGTNDDFATQVLKTCSRYESDADFIWCVKFIIK